MNIVFFFFRFVMGKPGGGLYFFGISLYSDYREYLSLFQN
jgi:hypothetical protein